MTDEPIGSVEPTFRVKFSATITVGGRLLALGSSQEPLRTR